MRHHPNAITLSHTPSPSAHRRATVFRDEGRALRPDPLLSSLTEGRNFADSQRRGSGGRDRSKGSIPREMVEAAETVIALSVLREERQDQSERLKAFETLRRIHETEGALGLVKRELDLVDCTDLLTTVVVWMSHPESNTKMDEAILKEALALLPKALLVSRCTDKEFLNLSGNASILQNFAAESGITSHLEEWRKAAFRLERKWMEQFKTDAGESPRERLRGVAMLHHSIGNVNGYQRITEYLSPHPDGHDVKA